MCEFNNYKPVNRMQISNMQASHITVPFLATAAASDFCCL